jgi:curli biogenesis system outer membrane secretion channel CsgG
MFRSITLAVIVSASLVAGCSTGGGPVAKLPEGVLSAPIQSVKGPKRAVAVGTFTTLGSVSEKYGDWDVGGGMGAMLTTALVESKRFLVVERAQLQQILTELQLKGEGVVSKDTGPELQQLHGAQIFIFGAVTEFGDAFTGSGVSGSISGKPTKSGAEGGSISREKTAGKIKMDIRVVDATTGAVLTSFVVEEPIMNKALDASIDAGDFSVGGNRFMHTPIGEAARKAITKAVQEVASVAGSHPWKGRVVDIEQFDVHINAGKKADIKVGDNFLIKRVVKTFTDPVSGKVLGERTKVLGTMEVTDVQPLMASGIYQAQASEKPKRGDLVVPE